MDISTFSIILAHALFTLPQYIAEIAVYISGRRPFSLPVFDDACHTNGMRHLTIYILVKV